MRLEGLLTVEFYEYSEAEQKIRSWSEQHPLTITITDKIVVRRPVATIHHGLLIRTHIIEVEGRVDVA